MNLNELRYIVALADEKSFVRAAARCFISQPALSVAVKSLEIELGVQIFERSKTEVSLTVIGEQIVLQAEHALDEVRKLREIAAQGKDQLTGKFRLGVIQTVAPYLLPDLIPILHENAPRMPLEIEENLTGNLEPLLRRGRLDAIIVALPFDLPGLAAAALYEENFAVIVPYQHPWAKRTEIAPSELAQEKFILLKMGHCFRDQLLEACPELTHSRQEQLVSNSLETVRNMVASGLGISVLPAGALTNRYQNNLVKTIPFTKPTPKRCIGLAWRKGFGRPEAAELLMDAIQAIKAPYMLPISKTKSAKAPKKL